LRYDLRVQRCPAVRDPVQRVDKLIDIGDPLFEEVTDTVSVRREQVGG
jgi:hypothetical protein